jgi:hypothetical protein
MDFVIVVINPAAGFITEKPLINKEKIQFVIM